MGWNQEHNLTTLFDYSVAIAKISISAASAKQPWNIILIMCSWRWRNQWTGYCPTLFHYCQAFTKTRKSSLRLLLLRCNNVKALKVSLHPRFQGRLTLGLWFFSLEKLLCIWYMHNPYMSVECWKVINFFFFFSPSSLSFTVHPVLLTHLQSTNWTPNLRACPSEVYLLLPRHLLPL